MLENKKKPVNTFLADLLFKNASKNVQSKPIAKKEDPNFNLEDIKFDDN